MEWLNRFWSNVNKTSGIYGDNGQYTTECWCWIGGTESGYGRMYVEGKLQLAHRLSWMIHVGTIPYKKCVLHKCDNRTCVNPQHLFIGTIIDNNQDRHAKGRSSGGRNGGGHKGEKNGRSILTAEKVKQIRRRLRNKCDRRGLAKEYGVTKPTIDAIATGRNWSHVS